MSPLRLVLQGARYYWRTHLGVVLGAALATMAVLTGSLLVGDSVKSDTAPQALDRVGKADVALLGGDRFSAPRWPMISAPSAAPALLLRGSVARGLMARAA